MDESNPYSAPEAVVADPVLDLRLGGRGERLGAAFIDGIISIVLVLPAMFFMGVFAYAMRGEDPPLWLNLGSSAVGFLIFVLVQGYPLKQWGQTWGKRLLKLKIVDLAGNKPEFWRMIGLRYGVGQVVMLLPFISFFYALVDALFIFRADKRCVHDHIAGTRVVIAD